MSEPIRRLIDGFDGAGVPVIEVDGDTYSTTTAVGRIRGAITASSPGKIAAVLRLFEEHLDAELLLERMAVRRPARITPLMFEHDLTERARIAQQHIVLPEGEDDRILLAAEQLLAGGTAATVGTRPSSSSPCSDRKTRSVPGQPFWGLIWLACRSSTRSPHRCWRSSPRSTTSNASTRA